MPAIDHNVPLMVTTFHSGNTMTRKRSGCWWSLREEEKLAGYLTKQTLNHPWVVISKQADGSGDHAEKCHKKIANLELENQGIFIFIYYLNAVHGIIVTQKTSPNCGARLENLKGSSPFFTQWTSYQERRSRITGLIPTSYIKVIAIPSEVSRKGDSEARI